MEISTEVTLRFMDAAVHTFALPLIKVGKLILERIRMRQGQQGARQQFTGRREASLGERLPVQIFQEVQQLVLVLESLRKGKIRV